MKYLTNLENFRYKNKIKNMLYDIVNTKIAV